MSGSVRMDEKGRWVVRYRLPNGTDTRRVLGPAWKGAGRPPRGKYNKTTAQAALDAILRPFEGYTGGGADPLFKDAAAEWLTVKLKAVDAGAFAASTWRVYNSIVNHRLLDWFGGLQLSEITEDLVEEFRAELAEECSAGTINQHRAVLNGIFKQARKAPRKYRGPDVMLAYEFATIVGKTEIDVYTPSEVEEVCRVAASGRRWAATQSDGKPWNKGSLDDHVYWNTIDPAIFKVAAYAGLRQGEVRGLRWRDISFENSRIFVRRAYTDAGGENRPKSKKGRSTPMVPQLATALDQLSKRELYTGQDDLVFPTADGGHVSGFDIRRRFLLACEAAGLRKVRFHDLRHTFGTMAVQKFALSDVQAMMGHADIKTTLIYVHYKARIDEANKLGDFISNDITGGFADFVPDPEEATTWQD